MLHLLQISFAYSRFQFIPVDKQSATWHTMLTGSFKLIFSAYTIYIRFGLMTSQCLIAAGVTLVFGPVFAPVVFTLAPGKRSWPFPLVETRRPLSNEDMICSKDVSLLGLNLWKHLSFGYNKELPSSVEASASSQAILRNVMSSWTSSHVSNVQHNFTTANSLHSICLLSQTGVAHVERTQASPSLWDGRCYGSSCNPSSQLLHILQCFFLALSCTLTKSLWFYTLKWDAASYSNNLRDQDPDNNGNISSDDDDGDAIMSYNGSAPSSPIQSFGNPLPTPAATHLDNSQFSMVVQVGTPNIIHTAQSLVTAALP